MGKTLKLIKDTDNPSRYNHPYHEYYDGTTAPFGKYENDGIYHLHHYTTSRYGYEMIPIFGVCETYKEEYEDADKKVYVNKRYHIFIGECPHKDENGKWVTYDNVPHFINLTFAGAHILDEEPDIPHIIRMISDEFDNHIKERRDDEIAELSKEVYTLKHQLKYCTFKTWIKGLYSGIKDHIGSFIWYKGKQRNQFGYFFPTSVDLIRFVFEWDKEEKRLNIWIETDKWNRTIDLIKNGKPFIKYEKWQNDHCYASC